MCPRLESLETVLWTWCEICQPSTPENPLSASTRNFTCKYFFRCTCYFSNILEHKYKSFYIFYIFLKVVVKYKYKYIYNNNYLKVSGTQVFFNPNLVILTPIHSSRIFAILVGLVEIKLTGPLDHNQYYIFYVNCVWVHTMQDFKDHSSQRHTGGNVTGCIPQSRN